MEIVGFRPEEVQDIFTIISGVLKVGNVEFQPVGNIDGTEGCQLTNEYGTH